MGAIRSTVYRHKTGVLIASIFLNLHFALVRRPLGGFALFVLARGRHRDLDVLFSRSRCNRSFSQVRPKDGKTAFGPPSIGLVFNSHRSPDVHDVPVLDNVLL